MKNRCPSPFFFFPLVLYFLIESVGLGLGKLNRMGAGFFPFTLTLALLFLLSLVIIVAKVQSKHTVSDTQITPRDMWAAIRILLPFVIFAFGADYFGPYPAAVAALFFMAATLQKVSLKARILYLSGLCAALFAFTKTFLI